MTNAVEHLVLTPAANGFKFRYQTKYHDDLGSDLQAALEVLEREGWQVVTALGPSLILMRVPR